MQTFFLKLIHAQNEGKKYWNQFNNALYKENYTKVSVRKKSTARHVLFKPYRKSRYWIMPHNPLELSPPFDLGEEHIERKKTSPIVPHQGSIILVFTSRSIHKIATMQPLQDRVSLGKGRAAFYFILWALGCHSERWWWCMQRMGEVKASSIEELVKPPEDGFGLLDRNRWTFFNYPFVTPAVSFPTYISCTVTLTFSGVPSTGVQLLDKYQNIKNRFNIVLNSYRRSVQNEESFEQFKRAGGSDFDSLCTQKLLLSAFVFGAATRHENPRIISLLWRSVDERGYAGKEAGLGSYYWNGPADSTRSRL